LSSSCRWYWIGRQGAEFKKTLTSPKMLAVLLFTSILVGGNWLIYVWAVNNGRVLQASLGYYINPLVNVVLGMVFLRERLRSAQTVAVILAGLGVLNLTLGYGVSPGSPWRWLSVSPVTAWSARLRRSGPWWV
jgi:chloramphenicol-sensitive protein RarD